MVQAQNHEFATTFLFGSISNTFGNVHVYNGQFVAEFLYIRDINKEVGEVERNWKVQTQPVQE